MTREPKNPIGCEITGSWQCYVVPSGGAFGAHDDAIPASGGTDDKTNERHVDDAAEQLCLLILRRRVRM